MISHQHSRFTSKHVTHMISQALTINFQFRLPHKDIIVSRVHVEQKYYRHVCGKKHGSSHSPTHPKQCQETRRLQQRKMLTSRLYKKRHLKTKSKQPPGHASSNASHTGSDTGPDPNFTPQAPYLYACKLKPSTSLLV